MNQLFMYKLRECEPLQFGSSREHISRDERSSSVIKMVVREPKPLKVVTSRLILFDMLICAAFRIRYSHL